MKFIDLEAQQKQIRSQIETNIHRVLDHGQYILGPEVAELEKRLATFAMSNMRSLALQELMHYYYPYWPMIFVREMRFLQHHLLLLPLRK